MPGGRPPNLFSKEDVIVLGKDLLIWLDSDGKEEFMFEPWYYGKHEMFLHDWKALIQRTEFLPYYEVARKKITANMVKNKDIPQSYGNRYLGIYDKSVREHEKELVKEKVELEKAAVNQTTNPTLEQTNAELAASKERYQDKLLIQQQAAELEKLKAQVNASLSSSG